MKILLVDDSKFMRDSIKSIITELYDDEVHEGESFETGLKKFKEVSPDLCFFDIVIGEKTGLDLLKEIRTFDKDTSVVMLSSVGQQQIIQEAIDIGANDFLIKPVVKEEMDKVIKQFRK